MYFLSIPLLFELVVECEIHQKFFQVDFFPSSLDFTLRFYRTGSSLLYGLTARFNRTGEDIQAKTINKFKL